MSLMHKDEDMMLEVVGADFWYDMIMMSLRWES